MFIRTLVAGLLFLGSILGFCDSRASDRLLSSIVGVYLGEIESDPYWVEVKTEFYPDSVSVIGKYRYEDKGGWDEGTLSNIRLSDECVDERHKVRDTTSVDSLSTFNIDDKEGDSPVVGLFGAAGKVKRKQSSIIWTEKQERDAGNSGICIAGTWKDSYGQGPVWFRFSPSRDHFSGYYQGPDGEPANWNGSSSISPQHLSKSSEKKVAGDSTAREETRIVSTEGESFYQRVDETGIGETKEYAIKEAHFFALERELTTLVGYQAEGEVGRWFRMAFDRDFDSFKKRYFTPNTGERRCTVNDSGKHVCSIEGSLKLAALKADMRKVVKTKERMLSDDLVFFLSSADAVDATAEQGPKWKGHANYFVDQLVGIFVRKGHRIIIGKKGLQAVDDGKVDYGLEVKRIDFTDFRQGRDYISGVLRVLFRLTHMGSSTVLASIPITVNAEVQSDSEAVLVTELSRKVSMQIALNVTETVITFQREQGGAAVQAEAKPGQETYFLRLMGLEQRDRKELKALRQSIRTMFPDSAPSTDPDQSDATQTTIAFSTVEAVNCDDVLDYFYEAYNDLPGFDATCLGRNEFSLYFRLPSAQPIAVEKSNQNSSGKSKAAVSCQGNWQEKLECRDQ